MGKATISVDVTRDGENQISGGTVTIFTRDFEIVGTIDVEGGSISWGEIESNVPGIKGVPESLTLDTGSTYTISATLKGISGTISWSNGGSTIVTVSNSGVVSVDENATNGATATITASADGCESKQCVITVRKVVVPQVGQVVNYAPSGTYNWDKTLALADQTGTDTLSSASGETYNVTQWKILSYDPNTKMVEMVPTAPKGSLRLQGAQGYNNAVYLLDNACSSLYGNSAKGITARSIKEEDFVKAGKQSQAGDSTTTNDWTRARANYNNSNVSKKYGEQTTAYTSYKSYPSIYANEYGSVINGTENTDSTALKGSEQSNSIGRTDNSATDGYLKASTSIQPYQTYYNTSNYSTTSGLLADGKAAVLMPNGSGTTTYWVASRCVYLYSNYCYFLVRYVYSGYLNDSIVFDSITDTSNPAYALFPVVSLSSELLEDSGTANTWNVNLN